jgi:hypothetical protein
MSRPMTKDDYLLIGGVLFVIFSCMILLIRGYIVTFRASRPRRWTGALSAGEDFREMQGPDRRPGAGERSLNLH